MTRRITKQIREDAWLICAIAASTPGEWYSSAEKGLDLDQSSLDAPGSIAHDLALSTWLHASKHYEDKFSPEVDAEAAALLAEGWTPEGWTPEVAS